MPPYSFSIYLQFLESLRYFPSQKSSCHKLKVNKLRAMWVILIPWILPSTCAYLSKEEKVSIYNIDK